MESWAGIVSIHYSTTPLLHYSFLARRIEEVPCVILLMMAWA
jgi:hypothetical protein